MRLSFISVLIMIIIIIIDVLKKNDFNAINTTTSFGPISCRSEWDCLFDSVSRHHTNHSYISHILIFSFSSVIVFIRLKLILLCVQPTYVFFGSISKKQRTQILKQLNGWNAFLINNWNCWMDVWGLDSFLDRYVVFVINRISVIQSFHIFLINCCERYNVLCSSNTSAISHSARREKTK